jgi:hypothetical protein
VPSGILGIRGSRFLVLGPYSFGEEAEVWSRAPGGAVFARFGGRTADLGSGDSASLTCTLPFLSTPKEQQTN